MSSPTTASAWQLDDKDWLAARQALWLQFQKKLPAPSGWRKEVYKALKEYFLTGSAEADQALTRRCEYYSWALLKMWMHPTEDLALFDSLIDEHISSRSAQDQQLGRRYFVYSLREKFKREMVLWTDKIEPEQSFLSRRALAIFELLHSERFVRDDYIVFSEPKFLELAVTEFDYWNREMLYFLVGSDLSQPNGYAVTFAPLRLQYWRDAMLVGYYSSPLLYHLLRTVARIDSGATPCSERQRALAGRIIECLNFELPDVIQNDIARLRSADYTPIDVFETLGHINFPNRSYRTHQLGNTAARTTPVDLQFCAELFLFPEGEYFNDAQGVATWFSQMAEQQHWPATVLLVNRDHIRVAVFSQDVTDELIPMLSELYAQLPEPGVIKAWTANERTLQCSLLTVDKHGVWHFLQSMALVEALLSGDAEALARHPRFAELDDPMEYWIDTYSDWRGDHSSVLGGDPSVWFYELYYQIAERK